MHCSFQTDPAVQQKGKRCSFSAVPSLDDDEAVRKRKLDEGASDDAPEHEPKRVRIAADEVEDEKVTGINEAVHHEMISLILQETTRHSVVMWVVCRRVCRL